MILKALSGFKQLAAMNAGPYFLGIAIAAFLAGSTVGFGGGRLMYRGQALEAKLALSDFKGTLAARSVVTEQRVGEMVAGAERKIAARDAAINADIARIPGRVAAMMQNDFTNLRRALNDPKFDCLGLPLPDDALSVLERPGGAFSPAYRGGAGIAEPARNLLGPAVTTPADGDIR